MLAFELFKRRQIFERNIFLCLFPTIFILRDILKENNVIIFHGKIQKVKNKLDKGPTKTIGLKSRTYFIDYR